MTLSRLVVEARPWHHNTSVVCRASRGGAVLAGANHTLQVILPAASCLQMKDQLLFCQVQFPPRVVVTPAAVAVQVGAELQLECDWEAEPREVTVSWWAGQRRLVGEAGPLLVLPRLKPGGEGQYWCQVENTVGRGRAAATITLVVPPTVSLAVVGGAGAVREEDRANLSLTCTRQTVQTSPAPRPVFHHKIIILWLYAYK